MHTFAGALNQALMILSFSPYTLYFKRPFRIAHGLRTSTPVMITRLELKGVTGYGEASMPPYLGESHQSVAAFLEKAATLMKTINDPSGIESILSDVDRLAPGNSAAKAAVDIALHDLNGKLQNKPCWKLFGCEQTEPYTSYTLGI